LPVRKLILTATRRRLAGSGSGSLSSPSLPLSSVSRALRCLDARRVTRGAQVRRAGSVNEHLPTIRDAASTDP
jgi:hypothetical protein